MGLEDKGVKGIKLTRDHDIGVGISLLGGGIGNYARREKASSENTI